MLYRCQPYVLRVSRWNGFRHLGSGHPVDAHGLGTAVRSYIPRYRHEAAISPMLPPVLATSIDTNLVFRMRGLLDREAALEVPVTIRAKPEHIRAQHEIATYWRFRHVLDNVGDATGDQAFANWCDQIRIM